MLYLSDLLRWLRLKRYQYEVTFSLYMLTPTEKIIFNTVAILVFTMIVMAASLYLPGHVNEMLRRAWFYYAGDEAGVGGGAEGGRGGAVGAEVAGRKVGGGSGAGGGGGGAGRMAGQDVMDMLGRL